MSSPVLETSAAPAPATGLLRFTTCGSVDDGKSTLIGRLLHDSRSVYEDQLESVRRRVTSSGQAGLDLALLTDGLRAEREQGITIDVAYRYFSTPRRSFIIADTPGHEQYTRNMATGASTADAAIILLDATRGVLTQSRRHAYIARLLGIPCLIAAVNKMDLVGYDENVFRAIAADFRAFAARLGWPDVYALPVSALQGDNVVTRSAAMPWFDGPPLLQYLETAPVAAMAAVDAPLRFPVQMVIRDSTGNHFRGFAGQVASGVVRRGDTLRVCSTRPDQHLTAQVDRIVTFDGDLEQAPAGASVTLALDRELDIGRGDMLAQADRPPVRARRLRAMLVWMDTNHSHPGTLYWLHQGTRSVRARIAAVEHRVDVNTLEQRQAARLAVNDIAEVEIDCRLPVHFDPYAENRATGAFILIDPATNATAAAGMILGAVDEADLSHAVNDDERRRRYGHPSLGVWISARPHAAIRLERALHQRLWNVVRIEAGAFSPAELSAVAGVLRGAGAVAIFVGSGDATDADARAAASAGYAADEWLVVDDTAIPDDAALASAGLAQLEARVTAAAQQEDAE